MKRRSKLTDEQADAIVGVMVEHMFEYYFQYGVVRFAFIMAALRTLGSGKWEDSLLGIEGAYDKMLLRREEEKRRWSDDWT